MITTRKLSSAAMRFQERPKRNIIPLEPVMISKLFWHKKTIRVQEDGKIAFAIKQKRYEFQIYEPVAFYSSQETKVKVYFDELNMQQVHVFDPQNRFLGVVEPRLESDGSGNHPALQRHREQKKAIDKYARDEKKKWEAGAKSGQRTPSIVSMTFHDALLDDEDDADSKLFLQINGIEEKEPEIVLL